MPSLWEIGLVALSLAVGVGLTMATTTFTPNSAGAKTAFAVAFLIVGWMGLAWEIRSPHSLPIRLVVGLIIGTVVVFGLPETFRWVDRQGDASSRARHAERQLTDAAAAPSLAGTEGSATGPGVKPAEPESKARPLNVELRFLEADPMPPGVPGGRMWSSLELRIANPNDQPVFANKAGIVLPAGAIVADFPGGPGAADRTLPVTDSAWQLGDAIPPHQYHSLIFESERLLELCDVLERVVEWTPRRKVLLVGWCEDGDGKRHESAPVEFDVEKARATATYP